MAHHSDSRESIQSIPLILALIAFPVASTEINCGVSTNCYQQTVNCSDADSCIVYCSEEDACREAFIYCGSICEVQCHAESACRETAIYVPTNSTFSLSCNDQDSCRYANVTAYSYSFIDIQCTGRQNDYSCRNTHISVGTNSVIEMLCEGDEDDVSTCREADIVVESESTLNLTCGRTSDCVRVQIDGRDAAAVTVNGCTDWYSCGNMNIYCPQHNAGVRKCVLYGDEWDGLSLYAVNSWDDVLIFTSDTDIEGTMNCAEDYGASCNFTSASGAWQCTDTSSDCFVTPIPTADPTMATSDPTMNPSVSPTTEQPSSNPTSAPSAAPSYSPTKNPSQSPSVSPSVAPSESPTGTPTKHPTESPTTAPSKAPTQLPTAGPSVSPTEEPTDSPTREPTQSPSNSPLFLSEIVAQNEDERTLEKVNKYMLIVFISGGFIIVAVAFAVMKHWGKSEEKMDVDDQKYVSILMYMVC